MMTNTTINAKVTEIELLEAQIKELKALAESARADLKAELDERQVDMLDTGIYHIFYEAYTKRTVDTKALKAAGLYDEYSKEQTNILFKITAVTNA